MSNMVNIESQELQDLVKNLVMKSLEALLSKEPPESQMALMLHAHIRDFGELHAEIGYRFNEIDAKFKGINSRLDHIEKIMVTKDDLSAHTAQVIDAVRQLLAKS